MPEELVAEAPSGAPVVFSVGHSTLSAEKFLRVLEHHQIDTLLDVRSHPGSTKWPWFNREEMERWLPAAGYQYLWEPRLGGWRAGHAGHVAQMLPLGVDVSVYTGRGFPKQRIAARLPEDQSVTPVCPQHGYNRKLLTGPCCCPSSQPLWYVCGFYDYSWFMALPEFQEGLAWLAEYSKTHRVAMCCQEGKWFSCHRSMISDALWLVHKVDSQHMPSRNRYHSQTLGNRLERYDPRIVQSLLAGNALATWPRRVRQQQSPFRLTAPPR